MDPLSLKKKLNLITTKKNRGSYVMEGVIILPFIILLLTFIFSTFNYYFCMSFIEQKTDSFGTYIVGVGEGEVEFNGLQFSLLNTSGSAILNSYLLKDKYLNRDSLKTKCNIKEGYLTINVQYKVDILFVGKIVINEDYERRIWQ